MNKKMQFNISLIFIILLIQPLFALGEDRITPDQLLFADNSLSGWSIEGDATWVTKPISNSQHPSINSAGKGEEAIGTIRSNIFTIESSIQSFLIAGADGTKTETNNGENNFLYLRSYPDGEILRKMQPPGSHIYESKIWQTADLIGQDVYLELIDNNPKLNPKGFAWIGLANYKQGNDCNAKDAVVADNLYALKIDSSAQELYCRTMPFLTIPPTQRKETTRKVTPLTETIPVNAGAKTLYILGMINQGWDQGVAHWSAHPELREERSDILYVGAKIGDLEIKYADGKSDRIPLVMGTTSWFAAAWVKGYHYQDAIKEPFTSRPEYAKVFDNSIKLKEHNGNISRKNAHLAYYLAITPRKKEIESLILHNNVEFNGRPLISAVTLSGAKPAENLYAFGKRSVSAHDLEPAMKSRGSFKWKKEIKALRNVLYTKESDIPKTIKLIDFPENIDATKIRLKGNRYGDMLSNMWIANLLAIDEKFDPETGFFHESNKGYPWYGGYNGIGTWIPVPAGRYGGGACPRSSDHFASLALRCINNQKRNTNYVDFVDKYFYYYRADHDPKNGPPNDNYDISKYPKDAPSHWAFVVNIPISPREINEIPGAEELDGHGATMVGRWMVWRNNGSPTGDWFTSPREEIYGKSRWDTSKEAAEFICWLMDYSGMDVLYSEGESTGWGGGGLAPAGWPDEKDPEKIKRNYANCRMYEVYPNYVGMTALRCSAQMAKALGDTELEQKWLTYANRIQTAMITQLAEGEHGTLTWRQSRFSILPSLQDSLVQAWFSIYYDGLDPQRLDPQMTSITRNTLRQQLSYPYGHAPVLGMGYGMGWLTKSALILDEMDDAGKLLCNIAKYSYDKNMDYVDQERGIDWRKYLWIVPEGSNILPDGSWYRVGDLGNGANHGPAMHAVELCAGIDDTKPSSLKILPRIPEPLKEIEIENFFTLVPDGKNKLKRARISYQYNKANASFSLVSDIELPSLSVRIGPFTSDKIAGEIVSQGKFPSNSTHRIVSSGTYKQGQAWWIWVEGMKNVTEVKIN